MQAFSDMPCEYRMAVRDIIDDAGGMVSGYQDGGCEVALPADRGQQNAMAMALANFGMVGDETVTYFPLGSDNPPDTMRHHGIGIAACPRGTAPSYWKYRTFRVKGGAA